MIKGWECYPLLLDSETRPLPASCWAGEHWAAVDVSLPSWAVTEGWDASQHSMNPWSFSEGTSWLGTSNASLKKKRFKQIKWQKQKLQLVSLLWNICILTDQPAPYPRPMESSPPRESPGRILIFPEHTRWLTRSGVFRKHWKRRTLTSETVKSKYFLKGS